MIRSSEMQLCTTQNRPVKFQVEKSGIKAFSLKECESIAKNVVR